jgi:signal recognition particle receptor subunit beta
MAAINHLARELVLKIVFYGPGLGGKTTCLQHIHDSAKPENRGKLVSLATPVDRTLYFDYLPMRLAPTSGMTVRIQLFTVPGQVYYNSTRKLVLTGADAIVFVADSQAARHDANQESLENLLDNLREQRRDLSQVPHLFLYNKRDLPDVVPIEELDRTLNHHRAPHVATVATSGVGVGEGLSQITQTALDLLLRPGTIEPHSSPLPPLMPSPSRPSSGLGDAIASVISAEPVRPPTRQTVPFLGALAPSLRSASSPASAFVPASARPGHPTTPAPTSDLPEDALEPPVPELSPLPPASLAQPSSSRDVLGEGLSFAVLWPESEREVVREAEALMAAHNASRALLALDRLATRVLASAGAMLRSSDAPRDPALIPVLLGVDGSRYLAFKSLVREARGGAEPDERMVLAAYAFVLELRLARGRVGL